MDDCPGKTELAVSVLEAAKEFVEFIPHAAKATSNKCPPILL